MEHVDATVVLLVAMLTLLAKMTRRAPVMETTVIARICALTVRPVIIMRQIAVAAEPSAIVVHIAPGQAHHVTLSDARVKLRLDVVTTNTAIVQIRTAESLIVVAEEFSV